ncbi:hypothetical protein [Endozoicomonas arenosclerae]|uniref:hypothetical protein n=1 Tax=Endozoicomonas arenosclerae TaxID=1633495 RepID=UPI000782E67B|nr:hypothetical protein [Endozoicomonas arenosclerae]
MKKIILFCLITLPLLSKAACNDKLCTSKIERLYITSAFGGSVLIKPADQASGILNCKLMENVYITLKKDHPVFEEIYSTLLSAKVADMLVKLRIDEASEGCNLRYVMLD